MDVYAVVRVTDLVLPEGARPGDPLPVAKSLILIGLAVPREVYLLGSRQKTSKFYGIIRELDEIPGEIVAKLESGGFSSVAVPAYFPARVRNGTLRGILSLKDLCRTGRSWAEGTKYPPHSPGGQEPARTPGSGHRGTARPHAASGDR